MNQEIRIILKRGKDQSLRRFHPWVFSGAIAKITGSPADGDVVSVYSSDNEFLGKGHYQNGSIMVRILSFVPIEINEEFWFSALQKAYDMRKSLALINSCIVKESGAHEMTTCYRLVHGEGDFLPGLIIDIYGAVAVIQAHSAGMYRERKNVASALMKLMPLSAIYDKSSSTATFQGQGKASARDAAIAESEDAGHDGYLYKSVDYAKDRVSEKKDSETAEKIAAEEVIENGNRFLVDWEKGQKTGFFLDQRDNRELVKKYSIGKKVLNLFCYTGGFSVYAMSGGAQSVDSVDSSRAAIDMAAANMKLNGYENCGECICADAIDFLRDSPKERYNLIIVDPPAFAKHRSALANALRAYKNLNAAAIEKVAPGGIIFTFSCSQVVDKEAFALSVFSAAAIAKRKVRIIHRLTQPADHPVNIYHPEGEYLKGLVLYVE